jgi:hypothetical protein
MRTPITNALYARALRCAVSVMFDREGVDLAARESEWVDQDSFDAGMLAAAHFLLRRADRYEFGELEPDV